MNSLQNFRQLFSPIVCIFLIGCASTSSDKKSVADLHLRMGTAHLQQGNYPQALQELLLAEQYDSKNPIVHNNLALAYFVRDKFDEAEKHLKTAIDLDSRYADAKNNLGRVYISMKLYNQAIEQLLLVTEDLTYPNPEKAYSNLALAYYKKNDFAKARDASKQALKTDKNFCPAQAVYGLSLFFLEDYKNSVPTLERTISQCEREKAEAHYYAALGHYKMGFKSKATARLQEIVSLYPESEFTEKAKTMLGIIK